MPVSPTNVRLYCARNNISFSPESGMAAGWTRVCLSWSWCALLRASGRHLSVSLICPSQQLRESFMTPLPPPQISKWGMMGDESFIF